MWLLQQNSCTMSPWGSGPFTKATGRGHPAPSFNCGAPGAGIATTGRNALALEKEQLRRSDIQSSGNKQVAEIQQHPVRWRRWWPVPHLWLSLSLCRGQAVCAPSVSVAWNKGHKCRDHCCQGLPVAEGRCPGWLKRVGGSRAVTCGYGDHHSPGALLEPSKHKACPLSLLLVGCHSYTF